MTVTLTKDDWQCYVHTPDWVINDINQEFDFVLASSKTAGEAQYRIFQMLDNFDMYGFRDTECNHVATDTVNKHFPDEEDVDMHSYLFRLQ